MTNNIKSKRDKVLKSNKKKLRLELILPVLILFGGVIGIIVVMSGKKPDLKIDFGNTFVHYEKAKVKDGTIKIPIKIFDDNEAKYYTHALKDKRVYFFAVKSADGEIRAAFDACDVCFHAKKGYRQDGNVMICNNCGQTFPLNRINVEKGGCNPAPLTRKVMDKHLVINVVDLQSGLRYF